MVDMKTVRRKIVRLFIGRQPSQAAGLGTNEVTTQIARKKCTSVVGGQGRKTDIPPSFFLQAAASTHMYTLAELEALQAFPAKGISTIQVDAFLLEALVLDS